MAKTICKYFLGLVPEGAVQESATAWKMQMKEKFNLKYALRSPAHITIKMPFHWNEAKEGNLGSKLEKFFSAYGPIELEFRDFSRFGRRVIFIDVLPNSELGDLQQALGKFCKIELKLIGELSDQAFHPHMTVAFKDTKPGKFDDYWSFVKPQTFRAKYRFQEVALLKRVNGKWQILRLLRLGKQETGSDESSSKRADI